MNEFIPLLLMFNLIYFNMSKKFQNPSSLTLENNLLGSTNFNLSTTRDTTMPVMLAVPIYTKEVLPGDKWRIKPRLRVRTAVPFNAALVGSFSVQLAWFFEPDSNLYGFMDNNAQVTAEQLQNAPLHTFHIFSPSDGGNSCTFTRNNGPGTLANYLYFPAGFRPQFVTGDGSNNVFCANRLYSYWDIMRSYYVNRQLASVPVIKDHEDDGVAFQYDYIKVADMDRLFIDLRSLPSGFGIDAADIPNSTPSRLTFRKLYETFTGSSLGGDTEDGGRRLMPNSGLFCTNFRSDVYTRVMSEGSGFAAKITPTTDGSISYNSIIGSSRLQAFINAVDITGGRFSDMMRFRWGVNVGSKTDRPYLLSVETIPLSVQEMRTTANTTGKAAASQVSFIDVGSRLNKISFNASISGTLMCIATIIPNVVYSEGIEPEVAVGKFSDLFQPEFANVSFENVPRSAFSALPNHKMVTDADGNITGTYTRFNPDDGVARNIAWWRYMSDVNRATGNLSSGESAETWVINRSFMNYFRLHLEDGTINEERNFLFTTYGTPNMVNYLFADTKDSAQNFIVQLGCDINVRRSIPKFKLPYAY